MPTSKPNTDTNNNSNNKLLAQSRDLVVGYAAAVAGGPLLNQQPGEPTAALDMPGQTLAASPLRCPQLVIGQSQTVGAAGAPQQSKYNNNNAIKQDQQQQNHNNDSSKQQHFRQQAQQPDRSLQELTQLIKDINYDRTALTNSELIKLVKSQQVSIYKLESFLGKDNAARCVEVRRDFYRLELAELDKVDARGVRDRCQAFSKPGYQDLEYEKVNGACCENVIGHVKVPVGLAGPLILDGEEIFVPLATTEGCLVASTCRGLSALRKSGGVSSRVRRDFMTRAPIVRFIDLKLRDALDNVERAIAWLNDKNNKEKMCAAFNLTSSHGKFLNYTMYPVNREIHIRFEAQTGDAMGMNMCSKGVESALKEMQLAFPTMEIVTLSGNMCTDKKAAGINWITGRGKSVECNAELPAHVVQQVFKVSVDSMIDRWKSKVMIGSALAASIGGFNSQAANILTAIFIATGQDPAQNVTSSNCMLILEKDSKGSLVVCCTMPSIECGTVGGGTILGDQSRYLQMMGVRGATPRLKKSSSMISSTNSSSSSALPKQEQPNSYPNQQQYNDFGDANSSASSSSLSVIANSNHAYDGSTILQDNNCKASSGDNHIAVLPLAASVNNFAHPSAPINSTNEFTNARKLARIICATVMAGELSLLAALTEGTLVKSHMRHNRSSTNVPSTTLLSTLQGGRSMTNSSCFGNSCIYNNNQEDCSVSTVYNDYNGIDHNNAAIANNIPSINQQQQSQQSSFNNYDNNHQYQHRQHQHNHNHLNATTELNSIDEDDTLTITNVAGGAGGGRGVSGDRRGGSHRGVGSGGAVDANSLC